MAARRLVLFDVDGTLLKSHGGALRAMNGAGRRVFGPAFAFDAVDRNGRLDPDIIAAALELNGVVATAEQLTAYRAEYLKALRAGLATVRALAGAVELVAWLRRRPQTVLGLVTGNYREAAAIKLAHVGLNPAWFVANGFADDGPTRAALVAHAMEKASAVAGRPFAGAQVVVIGDTPRDVECARAHGCFSVAVATGAFSAEALQAAGAGLVLPSLAHSAPILRLL